MKNKHKFLNFTGERIVPGAIDCEPTFAKKMYQEHIARYFFTKKWIKDKTVLDVGCGSGYGSQWMAKNGALRVKGFDISADSIDHAKLYYCYQNLSFEVASVLDFSSFSKYDVITCFELIEHVDEQQKVIQNLKKLLNDDGLLIISTPRKLENRRSIFHKEEFTKIKFEELLKDNFVNYKLYFQNNHFSSLISDHKPTVVKNIIALEEQFSIEQADYFIGVASLSKINDILNYENSALIFNDDSYVKLLERDNEILKKAEQSAREEIQFLKKTEQSAREEIQFLKKTEQSAREEIQFLKSEKLFILNSTSWKITYPFRKVSNFIKKIFFLENFILIIKKSVYYYKRFGLQRFLYRVKKEIINKFFSNKLTNLHPEISIKNNKILNFDENLISADIIYVYGPQGPSKRYRVNNMITVLRLEGYKVAELPFFLLLDIKLKKLIPKIVVFFRTPYSQFVDEYFQYAKSVGIKNYYDIDDLVFDDNLKYFHRAYNTLSAEDKKNYNEDVIQYCNFLKKCDSGIFPTDPLMREAKKILKECWVIPNTWNNYQLKISQSVISSKKINSSNKIIGYFSGSSTHDIDFLESESAILRIMKEYKNVTLRIVGELKLNEKFNVFSKRIERIQFVNYTEMLKLVSECWINIAPLELNNIFNECKSELKWFEAAIVKVPTIASPTEPYKNLIKNGINGFLASSEEQWYNYLKILLNNINEYNKIKNSAYEDALKKFSPKQLLNSLKETFSLDTVIPKNFLFKKNSKKIDWVVPTFSIGSGGLRNIFRIAHYLEQFGHDVCLIFLDTSHFKIGEIRELLNKNYYPFNGTILRFDGLFRESDIIFATHWTTVESALQGNIFTKKIIYFVQDFEPFFVPMGTEYILSENTYKKNLYCIASNIWCANFLKKSFLSEVDYLEFPINRNIYKPRINKIKTNKKNNDKYKIIFFSKPEVPRRCYDLGVMMFRELYKIIPSVEIIFFGSEKINSKNLDFPITNLGILPNLESIAHNYNNADLGVVFSTTNPSLVPYEMMACGLPVVDLNREGNELNYDGRHDIALLAEVDPHKMAAQIKELLLNSDERAKRSLASINFVSKFPSELEMSKKLENLILKKLNL
jgi:SAM-dependent methyltransferase/glycosyltransferase involved in cell wall biosynthesis